MPRPTTIGLTGSVAAGKSVALAAFEGLDAATVSTDAIVHELLGTDEVRRAIAERWGSGTLGDGQVDRAAVGRIVFSDPDELSWLEGLLHPLVRDRIAGWMSSLPEGTEFAVVEVPLLFEGGLAEVFDTTVTITASEDERRRRAEARGTALVSERDSRQLTQEEKAARADHAIANDGAFADLERALSVLLEELRAGDRAIPPESLPS